MEQIHGSIQVEVFFFNNNKVWVPRRQMNDYWLKSNCIQHSQWISWSVSYLWTTVIKRQQKVSLQWFQYRCEETFHSLWVASLVHTRSLGSNEKQWQEWICKWIFWDHQELQSHITMKMTNYNYRLTRKQFWITHHKKKKWYRKTTKGKYTKIYQRRCYNRQAKDNIWYT